MDLKSLKPQDVVDGVKDLMGLSSKKVIGVDIGLSSVKIAEVQGNGGDSYKLLNFITVPLPEAVLIEDEIQKEEELLAAIEEAFDEVGIKGKNVCLGLFGPNTVVRKLQLAGGSDEEIEDQVLWEAEQYLPFPVEESNLGHYVVGENEGGGVDVIVAAARKDVLLNFKDIIEKAQGKVKIVDLTPLAISNVFEFSMVDHIAQDEDEEQIKSWLILDIGAQKTECVIYKSGMPIFTKEIPIGGAMVTEEIQRQLGVNFTEAEDLKTNVDENGNLPEEVSEIAKEINETFFNEIKKTIDFYVNSTSDDSIAECFVTGGSIQLPGILDGLSDLLGIDVSVLNPFRAFEYDDKKIDESELSEIAYHGVVALGLAMREIR